MKKRGSQGERSSSEDKYTKMKPRVHGVKQNSDEQDVPARTRSRYKLSYNHDPEEDAENKADPTKVKKELKIEKKYIVDAKEEQKKVKQIKNEVTIEKKDEETKILTKTGQIPLKMTKYNSNKNETNLKILDQTDQEALLLVETMGKAYQFDKKAYQKGKIACKRILCFKIIQEKVKNLYLKRKFIEKGGLQKFCLWLLPMKDSSGRVMEPCIAVKMGLLRIVHDLGLESYQIIEYASGLWQIIKMNRKETQIPQLKNLCNQILKVWDFTLFKKSSKNANQ